METTEIVNQYKNLQLILGLKYIDVIDRLKLEYIPNCIRNVEYCNLNHSKKCSSATKVDTYQSSKIRDLLMQNRPINMLKIINDMCLRGNFPSEEAIFSIFQLILTTYPEKIKGYSISYILEQSLNTVENLLLKFPPCWYGLRCCYRNILLTQQNTEKYLSDSKNSKKQNIFMFVITMLEQIMSEEGNDDDKDVGNDDGNDSSLLMSKIFNIDMLNYHDWETKQASNCSFNTLEKNDKFDRLFLVIHIITKILELDLCVWILRNSSKNMQKHMLEDSIESRPFISLLFQFEVHNLISDVVKQILQIYISMIGCEYPENQIKIFTRLVSVLSVGINLCEQSNSQQIIYPNIGMRTKEFVKIMFKTVEFNFGPNIEKYLLVIKHIRIPLIKYLFIDYLLSKMNTDKEEMSIKKIVKNFQKKRWLQYYENMNEKQELPPQPNTSKVQINKKRKYPTCNKKIKKRKQSEIYRKDYLNLLLEASKSCCDVYALKNVVKLFENDENYLSELIGNNNANKINDMISNKKVKNIYDLDKVENDIENYVKKLNTKELKKLNSSNMYPTQRFDGIHINEEIFLKFREEIKSFMVLKENISKMKEKFGNEFNDFNAFMQEIFS